MISTLVIFLTLLVVERSSQTNPCSAAKRIPPKWNCTCLFYGKKPKKVTIKCVNRDDKKNLDYIPEMPNNTGHVYIEGYRFTNVTKQTFKKLESIKLNRLTLRDNRIRNISKDALSEMKYLQELEISREIQVSTKEIGNMLHGVSRTIKCLRFSHNTWNEPPNFDKLKDSRLTHLTLSFNYFRKLLGDWFKKLKNLHYLDVSFNGISENTYNFTGLENLTNLNIRGNWFKEFPNFCNSPVKKLKILHFQYNKLTEFRPNYFQCLSKLTDLNLNGHAIRKLYNNTFSNLTSLAALYIQRLAGQLFHIEARAFESASLKKLIFTHNGFWFRNEKTNSAPEYFKNCPQIETLNISGNTLDLREDEFISMLKPLNNLKTLGIRGMRLVYLPNGLLKYLPQLTRLDASNNVLNGSWNGELIFGNKSNLKVLDLSFNNIDKITLSNFPQTLLNGLNDSGLNVSWNKFSCLCDDVIWFYRWMHSNKKKLSMIDKITCRSNTHDVGTQILFDLTERDLCPINPALVIAIITFCSLVATILLVFALVYKLRWHIRYWLYVFKHHKKGYELITDDPDYCYDIYLVYADEDSSFIFRIAIPFLEQKGYKLCVRCRDFEVGKLHCDNIVDNINQSRRILFVLSNHFAKSKWCEFQMHFAYNRCLEEKRNNIIVAVLSEVSYKYLSNTLKVLLTSYDYALWSKSDETGQALFWGKVLRKLQFRLDRTESAEVMIGDIQ
ncbi:toll-like receptor 13 [Saccostrea echinata]|uniref:toll-like receptor 13 n=1 Tax=Saccostrea echinata TaxID=191078 RepID=UPI002A806677|nr:toll-like receptor 13 [Saccostrea echinata]